MNKSYVAETGNQASINCFLINGYWPEFSNDLFFYDSRLPIRKKMIIVSGSEASEYIRSNIGQIKDGTIKSISTIPEGLLEKMAKGGPVPDDKWV